MKWYWWATIAVLLLMQKGDKPIVGNLPRGLRNKNPGNIIKGIGFTGEIVPSSDSRFAQFKQMKYGVRALIVDLLNKHKRGLNTLSEIIQVYAPPSENLTQSYINNLSKYTGIGANDVFKPTKENIVKVAKGIAQIENGKDANGKWWSEKIITPQEWSEGWNLMSSSRPELLLYSVS